MPVMNPDGLEVVTEWYRRNVGTPFETVGLPVLYHKYAGHDNNRDWFMMLQPETRAVARQLWEEWYPQIVLNHHQTSSSVFPARLFIPPFADPVNPRIPPLVISGVNVIGTAMQHRFARERKPGVVSRMQFTQWWNGGMRTAPYFHNQIGILTEGALYRYATPKYHEPDSLPKAFRNGLAADRPSVWYPDPWRGGWWRLGDTVEYFVTASLGLLEAAADMREAWLYDVFLLGSRAIEAGRAEPFAYLLPLDRQHEGHGGGQEARQNKGNTDHPISGYSEQASGLKVGRRRAYLEADAGSTEDQPHREEEQTPEGDRHDRHPANAEAGDQHCLVQLGQKTDRLSSRAEHEQEDVL